MIRNLQNITSKGLLKIGLDYVGFMNHYDRTHLNINGNLNFHDTFSIGKGCRFDIAKNATANFGSGYVNSQTKFVIKHNLTIGDGCAISWGCQFIDDNFHTLNYPGRDSKGNEINIGNNVWIRSNVTILPGVVIPDGCIIAACSVVTSKFKEPNILVGGNPAKKIKSNLLWK